MINLKSADLTNGTQKFIALAMVGAILLVLWFLLPPLVTIFANLMLLIPMVAVTGFLIYNYQNVWDLFKRLSWNWTKKMISSDKLWYLWQGYRYLVSENERMHEDIKETTAARIKYARDLAKIAQDANEAKELALIEKDETELRILQTKVGLLDKQFNNLEPKLRLAERDEEDLKDYYRNRVADTEILKITLAAKAQEYEMLKSLSKSADNATKWMKESSEMRAFEESLIQIDASLDSYTANIEDFRRNVLPKMGSGSAKRQLDAQEGAKVIEAYKKNRLQLAA